MLKERGPLCSVLLVIGECQWAWVPGPLACGDKVDGSVGILLERLPVCEIAIELAFVLGLYVCFVTLFLRKVFRYPMLAFNLLLAKADLDRLHLPDVVAKDKSPLSLWNWNPMLPDLDPFSYILEKEDETPCQLILFCCSWLLVQVLVS